MRNSGGASSGERSVHERERREIAERVRAVTLLRDIRRWLPRFWRWVKDTRPVVLPLGIALTTVVAAVLVPPSLLQWPKDDRVRYCGIAFELVGIYIVVAGLHGRQRLFNRPTFVAQVVAWARRFPRLRPRAITMSAQGLGGAGVRASGRLSVWRAFRTDAPVEQRLETLETNLTRLKSEFEEQIATTEQRQRELTSAIRQEETQREAATAHLRTTLERLGAEGVNLEIVGVFWVVAGSLCANAPGEVVWVIERVLGLP